MIEVDEPIHHNPDDGVGVLHALDALKYGVIECEHPNPALEELEDGEKCHREVL